MLQQTRVEAVRSHYERFLERLPTVRDLASADPEQVVALWSGLGYYRRARALQAAARRIVEEHGAEVPDDREALLALPGIGPYTAGALLSIAFQRSEPLVDGNVVRVLSRLFGIDDPPGGARDRRTWSLARELVPAAVDPARVVPAVSPGNWNQALMELGALLCTPRSPSCAECPLASLCRAHREGRVEELPRAAARRVPLDVELELLLVESERGVLLLRREERGRMARMWELPTRERPGPVGTTRLWPAAHALEFRVEAGRLARLTHAITHHRIVAAVHRARLARPLTAVEATWARPDELAGLGLTGLTRKALARTGSTTCR